MYSDDLLSCIFAKAVVAAVEVMSSFLLHRSVDYITLTRLCNVEVGNTST